MHETTSPDHEALHKILRTFRFADAPNWEAVKANYDLDHPAHREMREHIRQHGIQEPIAIDYEQDPPEVVDGHTRLIHAEELGHHSVPVKNTTFADHHYYASRLGFRSAARSQEPPHCPCGWQVEYDPINGWQHADGSIGHDGDLHEYSVSDLMEGCHGRTAGKGKPRHVAPDVARRADEADQERPQDMAPDSGGDAVGEAPLRALAEHPRVESDLTKLPRNIQAAYHERVDGLRRAEPHSSTHTLHGPLKGWSATSLSHQYRVVHRTVGDELHVLSTGNHDESYNAGKRRTAATFAGSPEDIPSTPRGFRHYDPGTWGEDYTRHAQQNPNQIAVQHAHQSVRQLHPGISESLGAGQEPDTHVQHVLGELGHPDAEHAFAMVHPEPERGHSTPVYDRDGTPGVALHPKHWDVEHAAHEIAHILHNHETGRIPGTEIDDEQNHGPGFVRHFRDALNVTHPGAGDDLGEHVAHWKGEIDGLRRQARYTAPRKRLFGPTYGLDSRLFDGDQLKKAVREDVITRFGVFCDQHGYSGWRQWAKIVFFGSEASEWTDPHRHGNNDFDLSIGIHYPLFREHNPVFYDAATDEEIAHLFTEQMHAELNDPQHQFDGIEGTYDQTWFANLKGWNIAEIRPYSAYDVVTGEWIVTPPHLPDWSLKNFPEGPGLAQEVRGIVEMAEGILVMPEPYRTQNGSALWEYVHTNRSDAFGPQGEGWWDSRNVVEKALDQKGLMQMLWECHRRAVTDPQSLASPAGWSNDPSTV
jgi:hypothetical protein